MVARRRFDIVTRRPTVVVDILVFNDHEPFSFSFFVEDYIHSQRRRAAPRSTEKSAGTSRPGRHHTKKSDQYPYQVQQGYRDYL
jgi:hypothetical protein